MTKEPKLQSAQRIIPEWVGYDREVREVLERRIGGEGSALHQEL